jgi:YidC/Oxa1 family membrane protein insertase
LRKEDEKYDMNFKNVAKLIAVAVCLLCAIPLCYAQDVNKPNLTAIGGEEREISLGSLDPNTGFKFLLQLTTRGAAIEKATLSNFTDLNRTNPQPLELLSAAVKSDGSEVLSMENEALILPDFGLQLPINKLQWNALDVTKNDGNETAVFEAIIKDKNTDLPLIKLTKTYQVSAGIYDLRCDLTVENLSPGEQKIQIGLAGPVGIDREDPRADTRKAVAAFRDAEGQIVTSALDVKKLSNPDHEARQLVHRGAGFVWASISNKYFAAILVPAADPNSGFCNWLTDKSGWFTSPGEQANLADRNIGLDFKTTAFTLAPAEIKRLDFRLFIGPKDKSLFDKNPLYKNLDFVKTIDFMSCCCPGGIIYPLGFGILALMNWLYYFIPNYGIVIIILVLLVRLLLHPLTRKSQVSMSKYAKFNALPEVTELRKKYAKEPMELHKHITALQKEHGMSQTAMLTGMLPMMVQMPIWIALYGAIYASIDLRGAAFLPVWITDLSAPDAIITFKAFSVPLFGRIDSLNLLPILMGVAFYLQQKLTPTQTAATADPQVAQQQKMMMIMMPVLFPLMLYNSPSGLNLYIMASTFFGVIEQYVIKKHIREKEQAEEQGLVAVTSKTGGKLKKKKPKPFFKI